jgi:thiosulfate/3-mercaptopyruvate sulfurtransferase
VNIEWTAAVNGDGTFKSAAELAALYGGAGFTPDKQIITYCQSGVRGAHTWFVLSELLGYPNVRNYDGSWAEFGNNPESPIES